MTSAECHDSGGRVNLGTSVTLTIFYSFDVFNYPYRPIYNTRTSEKHMPFFMFKYFMDANVAMPRHAYETLVSSVD